MGMYDEIKCEYLLPDPEAQKLNFQTKDFDNVLDRYTITKEGRLIHHQVIWEPVPEEERPYYGKPEWEKGGFFKAAGSIKTVPTGDFDTEYHGWLNFYALENDIWYEYNAKFTDGNLVDIKRIKRD